MTSRNTEFPLNTRPLYGTGLGRAYVGDSVSLLRDLPDSSVDLVMTSPPFALRRQKTYGNVAETEYVKWLLPFAREVFRVLKDTGSFVLDLGGAYQAGLPARSLYNFRVLIALCDEVGFSLAEDFYWFNPAKLPSPIEWVNKQKIRVKDSVNTVWWFGKTANPKADVKKVLAPYSDRMKKLISNPEAFYKAKKRPSGHDISMGFGADNGGAIPPNLLSIPNTDSNSFYLRKCEQFHLERHPARFPEDLPAFFIKLLTDEEDLVVDIFAGSNTTGVAAERLQRKWIALDSSHEYLRASALKFIEDEPDPKIERLLKRLAEPDANVALDKVSLAALPNGGARRPRDTETASLFG